MSGVLRLHGSTGHVAEAGVWGHGRVSDTIVQAALYVQAPTVYDDPVNLTGGYGQQRLYGSWHPVIPWR